jgi:3-deoxy-D-manno-octulosonic-acid transferase
MYRTYTLALRLGLIVLSPILLLRSRKYWQTLPDRFGYLKLPHIHKTIWVHAVSVGEVKSVENLIARIRQVFPGRPVVLSTTTPTGQQLARTRTDIIDYTFFFPLDIPGSLRRTLDRVRPQLVIVAETEIWPNFLRLCKQRRIPVMMINGRISDKSFPRYKKVKRWLGPVLDLYTVLGMQSEMDRRRAELIGASPQQVKVFGNLKFDVTPSNRLLEPRLESWLRVCGELLIAASTMPGEDEMVLDGFLELRQRRPEMTLMIAPRHPERAESIAGLVRKRGLSVTLRTALEKQTDVLILNTVGELASCFQFAAVVFMGGSLVPRGGHNVLEPARASKPVIFGPHMENFKDIARLFLTASAAIQIQSAAELPSAVERVLNDGSLAESLGRNAHDVVLQNTGATERVIDFIRDHVFSGGAK